MSGPGGGGLDIVVCTDPDVITAVHWGTVTVAYRPYFPGSSPPTVAGLRASWAGRLADPTAVALVASHYGRPVGSVLACEDPDFPGGQLVALHVLPAFWGQGIGRALHDAALGVLGAAGYRVAGLWVIEANERARGLYERRGWVLQPGMTKAVHGVTEVRYHRGLPADYGAGDSVDSG